MLTRLSASAAPTPWSSDTGHRFIHPLHWSPVRSSERELYKHAKLKLTKCSDEPENLHQSSLFQRAGRLFSAPGVLAADRS